MINHSIVDTHVHLWDLNLLSYPWLDGFSEINKTFLMTDYFEAAGPHQIEAMIFVQADCRPEQYREELNWIIAIADKEPRLKGVVPWAPLEMGNAVDDVLYQICQDKRIKGIRRILEDQPEEFCIMPGFIQGVRMLGELGLHFELTISPGQFKSTLTLIDRCPHTNFVLDHIGNPDIANRKFKPWRDGLKALADSGPHYCKLSNLVCNADLDQWSTEDLKPYVDAVLDVFGTDRLMWGSDWPHVLRAASWKRWFNSADLLTSHLSDVDRHKIFHSNAEKFYRLKT